MPAAPTRGRGRCHKHVVPAESASTGRFPDLAFFAVSRSRIHSAVSARTAEPTASTVRSGGTWKTPKSSRGIELPSLSCARGFDAATRTLSAPWAVHVPPTCARFGHGTTHVNVSPIAFDTWQLGR
jgi:hypothetical protein